MSGRFKTLLADPPWTFNDSGNWSSPTYEGGHRPETGVVYWTMTIDDICDLGSVVKKLVDRDSFLFLWAPNAFVLDGQAQRVIEAWGFKAKQLIPWVKEKREGQCRECGRRDPSMGQGFHYTRVCTEQLILARRGSAKVKRHDINGIIRALRPPRHSGKPDESYKLIEALADGPYLELFARRRYSPAWTVIGNQIPEESQSSSAR